MTSTLTLGRRLLAATALFGLIYAISAAHAAKPKADGVYSNHAKTPELIETLKRDYGFSAEDIAEVRAVLAQAKRIDKLIKREQTAPEKTWYWYDYRPLHVSPANVKRGKAFMATYREDLARAEAQFGVPAEIIAAIMGVETKYGGYTGPHRILDSLATQGFDHPRRSKFFFSELAAFFALCKEKGLDHTELKGSYAGAMGFAQFMPSNYRSLAIDYDNNGVIDLWTPVDAIGSIGNYLVNYRGAGRGWRRGEPRLVEFKQDMDIPGQVEHNTRRPQNTIAELMELDVEPATPLPLNMPAGLIELQVEPGVEKRWIGLFNFYAILSYNPRTFYGMAVHDLAVELAAAEVAAR